MKTFRIILRVLLGLIILLLIVTVILVQNVSKRSIPDYNENVILTGLTHSVEVFRDAYGIPHIYAENELDLYRATGYLMAQDRLWQMDLFRRVTTGCLSEIFGEDLVDTDQFFRALRIKENSEIIMSKTDPYIISCAEAYADGINQYISQHSRYPSFEFSILRYKPDPWEAAHSFNLIGYMAFDQSMGWSTEAIIYKISLLVDERRLMELIPDLDIQDAIFPDFMLEEDLESDMDLMAAADEIKSLGVHIFEGSNNWVISGKRSSTSKPILCTDSHEFINFAPGTWYPMHLHVPGKLNVSGLGVPGCPFVIHGHNDSIAWGMTNVMIDDIDLYLETLSKDTTQYYLDGDWRELEIVNEKIEIKGGETVIRTNCFTHRGPIISTFKNIDDRAISMRWLGNEYSNEARALFMLNRAGNLEEFRESVKTFVSNSQCIAYADMAGNIGMFVIAGVPIRYGNPAFVMPGDTSLYDWKGLVPYEMLPYEINPEKGFLISANNRVTGPDYPFYISHWYVLPSRYNRIHEMLSNQEILSPDDMERLQADQNSNWSAKLMHVITAVLDEANLEGKAAEMYDLFRNWNGNMSKKDIEPTLFESFYLQLMKAMFSDELGEDLFNELLEQILVTSYVVDRCIDGQDISWCDDVSTTHIETFTELIEPSWNASIEWLSDTYGKDLSAWEWGTVHQISFTHTLGSSTLLKKLFKLEKGPYSVGGSSHTVSPYSYNLTMPFSAVHGSALRFIYSFADWDESSIIIPTGVSGIPASKFYCNQTEMYINNKYVNELFNKENVQAFASFKCTFKGE